VIEPVVVRTPPEVPFTCQVTAVLVDCDVVEVLSARLTTALQVVCWLMGTDAAAQVIPTEVTVPAPGPPHPQTALTRAAAKARRAARALRVKVVPTVGIAPSLK